MEYRRLGNSGLKVSTICLGAMMFDERTEEGVATRIVDSAVDAGVNFIDTADSFDQKFDADDEALIDGLVAPGHTSTPGYTDPKFPNLGRVARRQCP